MKLGLNFGIQAVQAGQKSATVNAIPQLIANSTTGKFTITAPVSKALNIAVGEYVMFGNNIANVEAAIAENNEQITAWAAENGVDLTTHDGQAAALAAFTQWYIAKGVKKYDKTGNALQVSQRFTREDKLAYIAKHAEEILAENREALAERLGNPDATDQELIDSITPEDIEFPTTDAVEGSKTASTGNFTGVGAQLGFTDSAVWGALKSDLGEDKNKKNRVFDVLLSEPIKAPYNNGYEEVEVTYYPIEFASDADVVVRGEKA